MTTRLSIAARTDVGRVRPTNEDAFLFADLAKGTFGMRDAVSKFEVGARGALLGVSDGMGGHKAGEVASAMTLDSLYRALLREAPQGGADDRIRGRRSTGEPGCRRRRGPAPESRRHGCDSHGGTRRRE